MTLPVITHGHAWLLHAGLAMFDGLSVVFCWLHDGAPLCTQEYVVDHASFCVSRVMATSFSSSPAAKGCPDCVVTMTV